MTFMINDLVWTHFPGDVDKFSVTESHSCWFQPERDWLQTPEPSGHSTSHDRLQTPFSGHICLWRNRPKPDSTHRRWTWYLSSCDFCCRVSDSVSSSSCSERQTLMTISSFWNGEQEEAAEHDLFQGTGGVCWDPRTGTRPFGLQNLRVDPWGTKEKPLFTFCEDPYWL